MPGGAFTYSCRIESHHIDSQSVDCLDGRLFRSVVGSVVVVRIVYD